MVRLTPEQVSSSWVLIRESILEAVPPTEKATDALCANAMKMALSGQMQVWAVFDTMPSVKVSGFFTTILQGHAIDGTKTLLVFSAYVFRAMELSDWTDCLEVFKKYSKAEGCRTITFYTSNPRILEVTRKLGFTTEYTYGTLDVA